jgi:hypothetical protein
MLSPDQAAGDECQNSKVGKTVGNHCFLSFLLFSEEILPVGKDTAKTFQY